MIKILCVGKVKESFYRDALKEYIKRLGKYTKIEIIEVPDQIGNTKNIILEKERNLLLNNIKEKDFLITLEIEGKELTSIELANKIENIQNINSNIIFIIGGSYGIHDSIKEKSDFKLSFSKMTFPHQLFRVILLEQIYRSYKILNNETYHK